MTGESTDCNAVAENEKLKPLNVNSSQGIDREEWVTNLKAENKQGLFLTNKLFDAFLSLYIVVSLLFFTYLFTFSILI